MLKITVRETAKIHKAKDLDKDDFKALKDAFTLANPHFAKKMAMGLSIFGVDQYQKYYKMTKTGDMIIPVGGLNDALNILVDKYNFKITDNRVENSDSSYFDDIKCSLVLRDYQKDIVKACKNNTVGVIRAKTGSGKTVCFVKYVLDKKQNTLILVNTKELASQTVEAFTKFTSLEEKDIGFVGSGRFELKPISVGILQTLVSLKGDKLKKVQDYYGQIITDETHIIAAETYFDAANRMPSKYKFGFSATPKREDGLTDVIHWATGPLIHSVPDAALAKFLIKPTYEVVETDYYFPLFDTSEYQTMITHQAEDDDRNDLIFKEFKKRSSRPSCFLCNRTSQVEILHNMIPDSIMLTSKMTKKQRKEAMAKLKSGEAKHVVSTFGLFSTGMDIPRLEVLYLCSPMKSRIKLKQAGGRLMRMSDGKTSALIIDFLDKGVGLLYGQWKTRSRILKNL